MARHTLRGQVSGLTPKRLIVDDGMLTEGHKIVSFEIWPEFGNNELVTAVLGTQYDMADGANAGDNRQIGWAICSVDATGNNLGGQKWTVIDPDHVVIRDLYVRNSIDTNTNYLVVIEPISLSQDQAVLQLIKERSQDDLR